MLWDYLVAGTVPAALLALVFDGALAGLVAMKIENVRLLNEHVAAQVIDRDLKLAKDILERLLPQEPLLLSDYKVEGYTEACYDVGGDYVDFFCPQKKELTLVIGGSYQLHQGRLRVSYSLTDTRTGTKVRARQISRAASDLFGLQDQLIAAIETGTLIASHTSGPLSGQHAMQEMDILESEGLECEQFNWVHAQHADVMVHAHLPAYDAPMAKPHAAISSSAW